MSPKTAPFGLWASPITTDLLTASSVRLQEVFVDRTTNTVYHLEGRPSEGGRSVLVEHKLTAGSAPLDRAADSSREVNSSSTNVGTSVHEYGGGPATAFGGIVVFSERKDRRLYIVRDEQEPVALTEDRPSVRYADLYIHPSKDYLIAIQEEHKSDHHDDVVNRVVRINLSSGAVTTVVEGKDFYSYPRFSEDGTLISWIQWSHPNMPWDQSALFYGQWDGHNVSDVRAVADGHESVAQSKWAKDGSLYFTSDRHGFSNLYRLKDGQVSLVLKNTLDAEFSPPDWVFGASSYDFLADGRIVSAYSENGVEKLAIINPADQSIEDISSEFSHVGDVRIATIPESSHQVLFFLATTSAKPLALYAYDLVRNEAVPIKKAIDLQINEKYISVAQPIAFPTTLPDGRETQAYTYYYPPTNADYTGEEGALPPLVVSCHGGPTAHVSAGLNLTIQYWTSRGFAFADVNYGGSSNYGREYRERLKNNWGIVDAVDVINAAKYLSSIGLADPKRLAITGGSAGGYLVLRVLTYKPDAFQAGASLYGISDLVELAKLTHKFEAHYMEPLLGGKYTDILQVYHDRSPINFADQITAPLLVQQGSEDRVVPPNQAELIVDAIKKKNGIVEYLLFEGEAHGFRKAENIKQSLESQLGFYLRVFGIEA
ncbi:dipeptidyl aminopeptidase/acylaminoacyl peptidase family protein [Polychytrium aggregatum]|uniref:dipeptidyl aminopeptidase/acylaminoacyl peptidase family protein n=1 Tax=Polychytrium aggregatum TaxID=110093 RepID=UPI0022FE98C1|nr:dipeptidyl aminopeptidase/acylaminoacyl peptidase family protein [Polychytrium aggregatum]KAI9207772.1 peptidase S9 prolyl oligopeptidase active site domain-containing protein [Polychytrium aggregatum]